MAEQFLAGRIILHCGDCLQVLATIAENSIDALVTDPPYHLTSIVKRFGAENSAPVKVSEFYQENGESKGSSPYKRSSVGFMGQRWDGGDIAFDPETWRAVLRVLKPGAHACVFCIPKHVGFVQVAMQKAGFEFRDVVVWAFGSGFPKSHDVSKGIDRAAGAEREVTRTAKYRDIRNGHGRDLGDGINASSRAGPEYIDYAFTSPATDAAREWEGWGTALKPAVELIILARKPLSEKTVAANVLRWGTGAINIDACRIPTDWQNERGDTWLRSGNQAKSDDNWQGPKIKISGSTVADRVSNLGRWPANLCHDGSEEVVAAFPESSTAGAYRDTNTSDRSYDGNVFGKRAEPRDNTYANETGSAARFFYTAKADADDRLGSKHPTVKPLDLMQWLVRLITPRRGRVLDCFAGTGTTGEAAWREGMAAVLIERESQYLDDIRRRMDLALSGPDERMRESIKAKNLPRDDGPLFDWPVDSGDNS